MKKWIHNQRGNSFFYIIWLLGIVAILLLIIVNMAKVYVTKAQANTAVEQSALAGTAVLLKATKEVVTNFDEDPLAAVPQKALDGGKSLQDLIDEKQKEFQQQGMVETSAYLSALNDILPESHSKISPSKKEISRQICEW